MMMEIYAGRSAAVSPEVRFCPWLEGSRITGWPHNRHMDILMEAKSQQGQGHLLLSPSQGQGHMKDESNMLMDIKTEPSHNPFPHIPMDTEQLYQHDNSPTTQGNQSDRGNRTLKTTELLDNNNPWTMLKSLPSRSSPTDGMAHGLERPGLIQQVQGRRRDTSTQPGDSGYHRDSPQPTAAEKTRQYEPLQTVKLYRESPTQPDGTKQQGIESRHSYAGTQPSQGHAAYSEGQIMVSDPSQLRSGAPRFAGQYSGDPDLILVGDEHVLRKCLVCGDEATGMYFGALVCVPCKTFFLRYAGDNFAFVCKHNKNCDITISTRTQCKYCRYQKCLQVGMCRKERPAKVELTEGQQLCVVCQDIANGVHFGAITCEGCKKFFRRGLTENSSYVCKLSQCCEINPRTRNSCRFCRYQKCLAAGMSREAIQMGRPSKFKPSHASPHSSYMDSSSHMMMSPGGRDSLSRSLSVSVDSGHPPLKMVKMEPLSPSSPSSSSYGQLPLLPQMASPGLPGLPGSPGQSLFNNSRRSVDLASPGQNLMMPLSSGMDTQTSASSSSMSSLSPGLSSQQQQLLEFLSPGLTDSLIHAVAQRASSSAMHAPETSAPQLPQSQPVAPPSLPSPNLAQVSHQAATRGSSTETSMYSSSSGSSHVSSSGGTQSQLQSSHPGTLSGGVATFFQTPHYIQGNRRYITNETIYNAFVKGALEDKVKLKERKPKSKSGTSGSSTSSRLDTEMTDFLEPDNPSRDQMATLNALTLASSSVQPLNKASAVVSFPSEPSTPALSSPPSPGRLELMNDLEGLGTIAGGNKSDTVDYILFNQLMTPPSIETLDGSRMEVPISSSPQSSLTPSAMLSDTSTQQTSPSGDLSYLPAEPMIPISNITSPPSDPHLLHIGARQHVDAVKQEPPPGGTVGGVTSGMPRTSAMEQDSKEGSQMPQSSTSPPEKDENEGHDKAVFSPIPAQRSPIDVSNKSPGSSSTSSSSASSQFGDNGSVYDYIIELSKQIDLIKRKDDSDSESSEKDMKGTPRDLLSHDTSELHFRNLQEYWLHSIVPDDNIMLSDVHNQNLFQIEKVYRQFVDTGTKINRRLKKELENWLKIHQGQFSAPPAWINEKVVPIYTLMSVTYCRNLPGFIDFHKHDQSIIIKLGQSQSRILVASKHWFDEKTGTFRDFMSWRGAKKGTEDGFKKELLNYAHMVQDVDLDDIEAAILNVLILIATDYPQLKNPAVIEKHRKRVMDSFQAYTTAKYGSPNNRIVQVFQLVPKLRELGLMHHRMTFHMRFNRTSSTSSNS